MFTIDELIEELKEVRKKHGNLPVLRECFNEDCSIPDYFHFEGDDEWEVIELAENRVNPRFEPWANSINNFMSKEGLEKALILNSRSS